MKDLILIGTRKSPLALAQTNLVIEQIKLYYPKMKFEIVPIVTSGDLVQDTALYDIGGKALFLKEIETALLQGTIDLAVHSLKDVPGKLPEGLKIAAMLQREDARDVFVCTKYKSIEELPLGSSIGSSSIRRKVIIQNKRPDLQIITFRGNVDSRIKKLMSSQVEATILAYSGLKRLNLFDKQYCHLLDTSEMLPAVGQGVIAVEITENNNEIQAICNKINHAPTCQLLEADRAFLEYLDADCKTPVAAYSRYVDQKIYTDFMLGNFDGSKMIFHTEISDQKNCRNAGIDAAKLMLPMIDKHL